MTEWQLRKGMGIAASLRYNRCLRGDCILEWRVGRRDGPGRAVIDRHVAAMLLLAWKRIARRVTRKWLV